MMDDLKFPIFNQSLPAPKKLGTEAYLSFVLRHLNHMGSEERKRQLATRCLPTGKRFTLFPNERS